MVLCLHRRLLWAVLGVVLLGGALEILQGYTGRDPDIMDFAANTVGALCGTLVGAIFQVMLRGPTLVGGGGAD